MSESELLHGIVQNKAPPRNRESRNGRETAVLRRAFSSKERRRAGDVNPARNIVMKTRFIWKMLKDCNDVLQKSQCIAQ